MTEQSTSETSDEDLTGYYAPDPPIRCMLPDAQAGTESRCEGCGHSGGEACGCPPVPIKYPHADGDVTVLGPEVFASSDGAVISWKGENYVRQPEPERIPRLRPRSAVAFNALSRILRSRDWPIPLSVRRVAADVIIEALDEHDEESRTTANNPPASGDAANNPLREQYAAIIRSECGSRFEYVTAQLLAVHQRDTAQLRRERDMALKAAREARGDVAHDTGPSVAECRDHDRRWDVEQETP
ncbi:hypothetical protein OOK29_09585 [Streptomyces phaeochromogenes]|uniref:hypothetical protein n=1 Tax=Streptomyces phaeochromogenes TaxID=1923 RepID=UPI00225AE634|nr:hypothetical protein [Streptomyces phaeochromogenes]MCX5598388.1 hypothetical protein [Streptomyces phaeochromogenes]